MSCLHTGGGPGERDAAARQSGRPLSVWAALPHMHQPTSAAGRLRDFGREGGPAPAGGVPSCSCVWAFRRQRHPIAALRNLPAVPLSAVARSKAAESRPTSLGLDGTRSRESYDADDCDRSMSLTSLAASPQLVAITPTARLGGPSGTPRRRGRGSRRFDGGTGSNRGDCQQISPCSNKGVSIGPRTRNAKRRRHGFLQAGRVVSAPGPCAVLPVVGVGRVVTPRRARAPRLRTCPSARAVVCCGRQD